MKKNKFKLLITFIAFTLGLLSSCDETLETGGQPNAIVDFDIFDLSLNHSIKTGFTKPNKKGELPNPDTDNAVDIFTGINRGYRLTIKNSDVKEVSWKTVDGLTISENLVFDDAGIVQSFDKVGDGSSSTEKSIIVVVAKATPKGVNALRGEVELVLNNGVIVKSDISFNTAPNVVPVYEVLESGDPIPVVIVSEGNVESGRRVFKQGVEYTFTNTTTNGVSDDIKTRGDNNITWIFEGATDVAGNQIVNPINIKANESVKVKFPTIGKSIASVRMIYDRSSPKAKPVENRMLDLSIADPDGIVLEGFGSVTGNTIQLNFASDLATLPANIIDLFIFKVNGLDTVLSVTSAMIDAVDKKMLILELSGNIESGDELFLEYTSFTAMSGTNGKSVNGFIKNVPNGAVNYYKSMQGYVDGTTQVGPTPIDLSFASVPLGTTPDFIGLIEEGKDFLIDPATIGVSIKVIEDTRPGARDSKALEIKLPVSFDGKYRLQFITNNLKGTDGSSSLPNYMGYVPKGNYKATYWERYIPNGIPDLTNMDNRFADNSFYLKGTNAANISEFGWKRRSSDWLLKEGKDLNVSGETIKLTVGGSDTDEFGSAPAIQMILVKGDSEGTDGYTIIMDDFQLIKIP